MKRIRKRSGASLPHVIVLLALLAVVFYLYANRKRSLPAPSARPGWTVYSDIVNTYDILVDGSRGPVIWYATSNGLKRYDRRSGRWDTWGPDRGLTGGQVSSLAGNGGDTLWLSTWYGVQALDTRTGILTALPLPATILAKRVFKVVDDGPWLWIGTDGRGIYRYRKDTGGTERFTEKDGMAENSVYAFWAGDTAVWAGGAGAGLSRYSRGTGTWRRMQVPEDASAVTKIWTIRQQGSLLWMATSDAGIWRYDLRDGSWRTYRKGTGMLADGTYTLAVDGDDVWVGTHYCLMRYSAAADAWLNIVKPGIHDYLDVTALAVDDENVWYGTFRKGIGRMEKTTARWTDVPDGLTRDAVCALYTAGDTLLAGFGYDEGCMDRLDRNSLAWLGNVNRYEGMDGLQVECITGTAAYVYAGTWAGLYVMRRGSRSWNLLSAGEGLPDNDVSCLLAGPDGVWVGTGRGLAFLREKTMDVEPVGNTPDARITALAAGGDGSVWAAAYGGTVYRFGVDSEKNAPYLIEKDAEITSLTWFRHRLWAGTRGRGVFEFDPGQGSVVRHARPAGLLRRFRAGPVHDRINGFCSPAPGILWMATDGGISILDSTGHWDEVREYDGLYDDGVSVLYTDDRYVWAGHYGGITRISRDRAYPYETDGR